MGISVWFHSLCSMSFIIFLALFSPIFASQPSNEALEKRLSQLEGEILALTSRLSVNTAEIESNSGAIESNNEAIAALENSASELPTCEDTNDCCGDLEKKVDKNTNDMVVHWTKILENDKEINSNQVNIMEIEADIIESSELISANALDISSNTVAISDDKKAIQSNTQNIGTNRDSISTNTGAISTNKKASESNSQAIAALENSAFVGVCAYKYHTTSTGTLTYDSISSSFITDTSYLSTSTGTFTASTSGLYMVTWSAATSGRAYIFLYQQGVAIDDTVYVSDQSDEDMGSKTVMVELCPGEQIHLGATSNTDHIYRLQFCVTLAKEMPACP